MEISNEQVEVGKATNRFGIRNDKIYDYCDEEPIEMTTEEVCKELNRIQNNNEELSWENQDLNWQTECLSEEVLLLEKTLELMAKSEWADGRVAMKFLDTKVQVNSQVEYLEYFKIKAKEMMKSE